ncbi:MAG: hypothetical protein GY809_14725, partial [Planctomycetes bacterium]|nr:hypothetical protein [Planctomycetota bacterium]
MFTHMRFPHARFTRTRHHTANGEGDCLVLQWNVSGRQTGMVKGDVPLALGADRIVLQDFAHCYTGVSEDTETYGVAIPRHLLQASDLIYRRKPVVSWGIDSPQGKLLVNALSSIGRDVATSPQQDAEVIAGGFMGLLNGLLATEGDLQHRRHVENVAFEAMKDHIAAHLVQKDLD